MKSEVIQRIKTAFRKTPYPKKIVASFIDEGYCIHQAFNKKHWSDIDFEILCYYRDSLIFMTPSAVRFYIPAFMIAALTDTKKIDTGLDFIFCVLQNLKKKKKQSRNT